MAGDWQRDAPWRKKKGAGEDSLGRGSSARDSSESFSLGADLCKFFPEGLNILVVTGGYRLYERAAIQDGIHHACKSPLIGLVKVGHEHSGLSVGQHNGIPNG